MEQGKFPGTSDQQPPLAIEQANDMLAAAARIAREEGMSLTETLLYVEQVGQWMLENGYVGYDGKLRFPIKSE
jgi:hypothetical protein